jgi:dTDP-4-dehydrorhamnose 3,5-epimerase-like enzyme
VNNHYQQVQVSDLTLGSFVSSEGALHVFEFQQLPFVPRRLYWINGVPKNATRGKHGHKHLEQAIGAVAGSCSLTVQDGNHSLDLDLVAGNNLVYIPAGHWRKLYNFSEDCTVLVVASEIYDEEDYIRDFDEFLDWKKNH